MVLLQADDIKKQVTMQRKSWQESQIEFLLASTIYAVEPCGSSQPNIG